MGERRSVADVRHRPPCSRVLSRCRPREPRTHRALGVGRVAALVDVQERDGHPTRGLPATSPEEMRGLPVPAGTGPSRRYLDDACRPEGAHGLRAVGPPLDASVDGFDLRPNPYGATDREPPIPVGCLRIACRLRGCDGSAPRALRGTWRGGDWSPRRDDSRLRASAIVVKTNQMFRLRSCLGLARAVSPTPSIPCSGRRIPRDTGTSRGSERAAAVRRPHAGPRRRWPAPERATHRGT